MKMIKFFVAAAMLAVSVTASAQSNKNSSKSSSHAVNTSGWTTFYLQVNPSTIERDVKGADDQSFTGLSVGYNKAFSVLNDAPLFIEAGAAVQYSFYTEDNSDDSHYDAKVNMLSAKIPVSLMYKFDLSNNKISLVPFAGIDFRYNLSGKRKVEYNTNSWDQEYGDEDYNLFDKKDMGGKDGVWKRFQMGWHIGVNAYFCNNWLLGLSYGSDFSEISKKAKINTTSVTLGYMF